MRTGLQRALWVLAPLALFAACRDGKDPMGAAPPSGVGPRTTISDATREGNPHFYWLPPMAAQPDSFAGSFDATLQPRVQICELEVGRCGRVVAEFGFGKGTDAVRVSAGDEHYVVNWHTRQYGLDPERTYRITVAAAAPDGPMRELGHADVDVVASQREMVTVETARYVGLVAGTTLPIKFRIEQGALAERPLQKIEALRPDAAVLHVNPLDAVFLTRPAGDGEVVQYLTSRDEDGTPTRIIGAQKFSLSNASAKDALAMDVNGRLQAVEMRDGSSVVFEYPETGKIRVRLRGADGTVYSQLVDVSPTAVSSTLAGRVETRSTPLGSALSGGVARIGVEAYLHVDYGTLSRPASEVPVFADWSHNTPEDATSPSRSGTIILQEDAGSLGYYHGYLPVEPAPGAFQGFRSKCSAFNAQLKTFCDAIALPIVALSIACAAAPAAPPLLAACAAVLILDVVCAVSAACEFSEWFLDNHVDPTNILGVHVRTLWKKPIDDAVVDQTFNLPLPDDVEFDIAFPLSLWVDIEPERPVQGPDYLLRARVDPVWAGVAIHSRVIGPEAERWILHTDASTNSQGIATIRVPSPEPGLRGNDLLSLKILDGTRNHTERTTWVQWR